MAHASPQLAAVLWDMDGTLVDTEPLWIAAEYALVEEFGGTWSDAHAHALVGSDLLTAAAYIRQEGGVELEPREIVERLLARVVDGVGEQTVWRPGARELLAALADEGVRCALVTMSWRSLAEAIVDQLPRGTFGHVVTGDQVEHGKPHPEPYLLAARRLRADPERCVALEDSPTGVASAEAAGCIAVAVPHVAAVEPALGRTILPSLEALTPGVLRDLVARHRLASG